MAGAAPRSSLWGLKSSETEMQSHNPKKQPFVTATPAAGRYHANKTYPYYHQTQPGVPVQTALSPLDTFVPGTLTLVPPSLPWHPYSGPGTLTLPWFSGALLSLGVITDPGSWHKYVRNVFRNSGYFHFFMFIRIFQPSCMWSGIAKFAKFR
ncbi:hypothetical protein E2C01_006176 [Portunus trituberculatus]|uniref:Uncharacterized protein n=1 Tax=Portunus trituberculatus TaxID=210409 RepID=A0A5B7CUJ8_PORTR|nr:hypothetical protein [Portunus trituberculatus]